MHRVVKGHLSAFNDAFGICLEESKAFEAFCSYSLFRKYSFDAVEPESLIYDGDDPGIDAIMIFINDKHITTPEEMDTIFGGKKNDNDLTFVFVQAKTSESWVKSEINTFESAVLDFLSEKPQHKMAEALQEKRNIFDLALSNVGKIKGGKPNFHCFFVTSAHAPVADEILNARSVFEARVSETGLARDVVVELMDRDGLIDAFVATKGGYDATFRIIGSASFPKSPGIEESYAVTLLAKDFIGKVLDDGNGNLRKSIFDENVRDFIDFDDSEVNTGMKASLSNIDSRKRFGILNNGVTIVSPDVRLQSNEIYISNYQIVNGCQTSNVLFDSRDDIDENTTLMVKIIETKDQVIVDDIVKSTNSQNKIEDHQFMATMDCIKNIERYFAARSDDQEQKMYFERRPNQYDSDGVPNIRIFNIKELARCCGAMFFDRPDLSARYPNQLIGEMRNTVFNTMNKEEIYYTSAYSYYRLRVALSNQRIDPMFNQMKWHALMAVKYALVGGAVPNVGSHKIETVCARIVDFMSKNDAPSAEIWKTIAEVFRSFGPFDRDMLRSARLMADIRSAVISNFGKTGAVGH
ncbi:AIPR family protein [Phreatobacter sp.]|uniref:AIPR family protein n=1 Tax=Phreatobacter sp. TaxID=1966341 RepID=UPI0025F9174B|nr:AIPR family protein [Phreatobacter sp.]